MQRVFVWQLQSSSKHNSSSATFRFVSLLRRPLILRCAFSCSESVSTSYVIHWRHVMTQEFQTLHYHYSRAPSLLLLFQSHLPDRILNELDFESTVLTTTWILQGSWSSSINFPSMTNKMTTQQKVNSKDCLTIRNILLKSRKKKVLTKLFFKVPCDKSGCMFSKI